MKLKILQTVTNYYLKSNDFNGFPLRNLNTIPGYLDAVKSLIEEGIININFGDIHPNSHILALEPEPKETQISKLSSLPLEHVCLYPSKEYLKKVVKKSKYIGKPFSLMLALGEPQLSYKAFNLAVLEKYRSDPRYHFDTDDIHGSLSVGSKHFENGKMYKRDEVFIQTFGFAYNKTVTRRAVAVYIRYLADLTPEHQQYWYNNMLKGKYLLHPDYHRATMGHWPEKESLFVAFIEEMIQINKMADLIGKPPFFKKTYAREEKPKELSFLIRPTKKEFNSFVHLLDKLLSENINKAFFKGDVPLESEEKRSDGRVSITQKGSLLLLTEWLQRVSFPDPDPKIEMLKSFKKIRKMRQPQAHDIEEDFFNHKYFSLQRSLAIEAYSALRRLRLIFANHPNVKGYTGVPDWLYKGEIWTY